MTDPALYRSTVFTATAIGGLTSHEGGDYLVQSDRCARFKQQRTKQGRISLAIHGLTYGATQFVTKAAVYAVAGLRVPLLAQLAGTATEIIIHVVFVDDGRLLRLLAYSTGKGAFHELGAPRQITGVVDMGNGDIHPVHLVDAETGADGRRVPKVQLDKRGDVIDTVPTWDNPNPSTGRALMDQALHKWVQVLAGAAVTTVVAVKILRRRK